MLIVPIDNLLDYQKCYLFLLEMLHPEGLTCPCGCKLKSDQRAHTYNSTKLPNYRCKKCGKVFNIFTETIFKGIHYSCIQIFLMLRGIAQGKTTLHLSKELNLNYKNLLDWRHKLQEFAYENRDITCLTDQVVESDEVFINAGEKGEPHLDPDDAPRVRANKKKG